MRIAAITASLLAGMIADRAAAQADDDSCAVLNAFLLEHDDRGLPEQLTLQFVNSIDGVETNVGEAVVDLSGMPIAAVSVRTVMFGSLPELASDQTFASDAEYEAYIEDAQREPWERKLERARLSFADDAADLRTEMPTLDEKLEAAFRSAMAPSRELTCEWGSGVVEASIDADGALRSPWRRTVVTPWDNERIFAPTVFSFTEVGFSEDGDRALIGYSTYTEGAGLGGWSASSGYVLMERGDAGWRSAHVASVSSVN